MEETRKTAETERENDRLRFLLEMEDLAEKKTQIYARLLTEPSLAKQMEELSYRHSLRKGRWETLLYGQDKKKQKKQNEATMSALNGAEEEK